MATPQHKCWCVSRSKQTPCKLFNVHFGHTSAHYRPTESLFMPSTRHSYIFISFLHNFESVFLLTLYKFNREKKRLFYITTINSNASHMNRRWKRRDLSTCHHVSNYFMSSELTLEILPPRYPTEDKYIVLRSFGVHI
jgi:hypothetical protein